MNEFGILVKKGEKKNDQTIGKDFVVDDASCKIFRQIEWIEGTNQYLLWNEEQYGHRAQTRRFYHPYHSI